MTDAGFAHVPGTMPAAPRNAPTIPPGTRRLHVQQNLRSADMVEVSVALAEALILDREGSALQRRARSSSCTTPPPSRALDEAAWDEARAAANRRRVDVLSESLLANEIYDLQVLRNSLVRQAVDEASRANERAAAAGDSEAAWHADLLRERTAAVSGAVERKGGWRSAVFLESGEVDVRVDVGPWPAADGVRMLQTVKSALVVQLEEVGMTRGGGLAPPAGAIHEPHVAGPGSHSCRLGHFTPGDGGILSPL